MATIYCDSAGSNTSPYDTWAKAATTLQTALTAWTTGNVILVKSTSDVAGQTSTLTITEGGTSIAAAAPIYTANASDVYTASTSGNPTLVISDSGADLTLHFNADVHGFYVKFGDTLAINDAAGTQKFDNCTFHGTGSGNEINTGNTNSDCAQYFTNASVTETSSSSMYINHSGGTLEWCGGTISVTANSTGLIRKNNSRPSMVTFIGVDFSGTTFSSNPLVDSSSADDAVFEIKFINCLLPATEPTITDGIFGNDNQIVELIGTSGDGDIDEYQLHCYRGTITPESTIKPTSGGSSLSITDKFDPSSNHKDGAQLVGRMYRAYVDSTGSKTVTVQTADTLSGGEPHQNEAWIEVFYLGTTSESNVTLGTSRPADLLATTALGTGVSWNGSPTRTAKLETTVTVNVAGWIGARVVLGGDRDYSSETGAFYVDPLLTVT